MSNTKTNLIMKKPKNNFSAVLKSYCTVKFLRILKP